MMNKNNYGMMVLVLSLVVATMTGCASTKRAREANASGFLGDYSKLSSGADDEALWLYIKPSVDWGNYRRIIVDPVRVYASSEAGIGDLSREELQGLVNYFDAALREQLAKGYRVVTKPGPGTMRLRVALTDAKGSSIALDTISNVLPPALAISTLQEVFTGSASGVGKAAVESELVDASTGERLVAAVDARVGSKTFEGKFDQWDDVKQAIDHWAERLTYRLMEKRSEGQ